MAKEITLTGRLAELAADIQINGKHAAASIAQIGRDLLEAKQIAQHGEWMGFLRATGFSVAAADNYMRYAREIPEGTWMANLPYSKALALLSLPEGEREDFAKENEVEDKSAAEIKRLISEQKKLKEQVAAEKVKREAAEQLSAGLQEKLENQPEKIIRETVAPADYEPMKEQIQRLKRRAEEAEEAACEAEERAAQAVMDAQKAMMSAADDDHPEVSGSSGLSLDDFISTCNEFTSRVWSVPFMDDYFREAGDSACKSYQLITEGIRSWAEQVLSAIERAKAPILLEENGEARVW